MSDDPARLADEVARRSYGKLVALLAARTRDLAAAEDALADAFLSALVDWPKSGCPRSPEAWLLTVARRKWLDSGRRTARNAAVSEHLRLLADEVEALSGDAEIPDRRLALIFACAHPSIEESARTPLILQVVLGLDAKAIASAFLTSPAAMGKRLSRAKEKIREAARIHSLALRLVRVAHGELDAAIAGGNSHDWDLAAADLLVHEAGGMLTSLDGRPLTYNMPNPVHSVLVAAGRERHPALLDLVRAQHNSAA